jgi:magnesium transporter
MGMKIREKIRKGRKVVPRMRRTPRRSQKAGAPPGTLIHLGDKRIGTPKITLIDYNEHEFEEKTVERIEETFPYKDKSTITWINVAGIHQTEILEKLGQYYGLHPLVLEDILNTDQRPKMEDYEQFLFIVLKMLSLNSKPHLEEEHSVPTGEVEAEQVSLILGKNFVISFQETEGDLFDPIRERIRNGKGRIRKMGADYLTYLLIDIIVDNYFIILEKYGERIEVLEDYLTSDPTAQSLHTLHVLKREMIFLRKSTWPLRELISGMERSQSPLITQITLTYLRDVYDHTIQVIDTIETYRDMLSGMVDTYLTSISNRTNEVMKVLTVIATIFIPLTFITGIFGMNFIYIPLLKWDGGFFVTFAAMILVSGGMMLYFKSKRWF